MRMCEYCEKGKPLVIGETNDFGISLKYMYFGVYLEAYGYDVHGMGSNGLDVKINYCPMCGRKLNKECDSK